jgi:hypothetical protein
MARRRLVLSALLIAVLCWVAPDVCEAVDTVEVWDVGATDIDFYTSYDGVGLQGRDRELSAELMAGFGLIEGLSAYLGAAMAIDQYFSQGGGEVFLGAFGTPVDTDHFDLDLFMDFRLGGETFTELQVSPAMELNFDLEPDLQKWGMYLMVAAPIYGHDPDADGPDGRQPAAHVETTLGTYLTLGSRHQILLDYEMAWRPAPAVEEQAVEVGSIGLGYNVMLTDALELVSEVRCDVPQRGEEVAFGITLGIIAGMPSPKRRGVDSVAQVRSDNEG